MSSRSQRPRRLARGRRWSSRQALQAWMLRLLAMQIQQRLLSPCFARARCSRFPCGQGQRTAWGPGRLFTGAVRNCRCERGVWFGSGRLAGSPRVLPCLHLLWPLLWQSLPAHTKRLLQSNPVRPPPQAPHRAAREQGFLPECSGVFISRWHHGSPSHRYGLFALHFVAEVNGQKTPDMETFLQVRPQGSMRRNPSPLPQPLTHRLAGSGTASCCVCAP